MNEIFQMRELTSEQFARCEELYQLSPDIRTLKFDETEFFKIWTVESNGHQYQTLRFFAGFFAFCSCPGFQVNQVCKHIGFIYPPVCPKCQKETEVKGEKCLKCSMDESFYSKPEKPSEKIQGFRI